VFGKAGRAETALDPAPLSMFETIVRLKPRADWRPGMTLEKIIAELDEKTKTPGMQGAWTMPIKARVDMLSTGIRTPVGVKVFGPDLEGITKLETEVERAVRDVPGTRSVYAERELGGYFLDVTPNREAIARYGVSVRDVLDAVESSIGGVDATTTFEGRERYRVVVRYPRELRGDPERLAAVLVPVRVAPPPDALGSLVANGASGTNTGEGLLLGNQSSSPGTSMPSGLTAGASGGGAGAMGGMGAGTSFGATRAASAAMGSSGGVASAPGASPGSAGPAVPLGQLATITPVLGPPMIKSEMGRLAGWVYVDPGDRDVGGFVDDAKAAVAAHVTVPPGYTIKWTGQYELLERVRGRLAIILPLTLAVIIAILYINFRGAGQTALVLLGVPFAAIGSIWTLAIFGFNTSVAVWVGMIALLGVAAETASVMVVYLEEAWTEGIASGRIHDTASLVDAVVEAGSLRVRPLLMTVLTNVFGLLPVLFDTGVGADVAKRIAAPMWGGLVSLLVMTLIVVPSAYVVWRGRSLARSTPSPTP
jgi:Cu(I)/Ag(I) efflux system membrane protein CusA/SilA